jgi:hypothetical protein
VVALGGADPGWFAPLLPGGAVYERYMQGGIRGSAAGGRDLLCPVVPEHAGRAGRTLPGWSRGRFREGTRVAGGASACGFGTCTGLYVAVRAIGGVDGPAHVHIVDSVAGLGVMRGRFRRSEPIWRCRQERPVKPSAQPTLVRTQHPPPPAKTAPGCTNAARGAVSFLSRRVSACVTVSRHVAVSTDA